MGVIGARRMLSGYSSSPFAPCSGRYSLVLPQSALSTLSKGGTGLFVGSATTGSLVRSAVIALLHGALARMLLGLMMADHAAGAGPQKAMMTGIMPGDPADHRTF